jgi:predicted ATPase/DNA-binding CsgD family transcriptional regulator
VTLTGPGGVGKTRLALAAAEAAREAFPGGVWFVPLAPLRDPALIGQTIARTIGVGVSTARSFADAIAARVRGRQTLIVPDNVEHLLSGTAIVGELLAGCRELTVLATSRTMLRLRGEHVFAVPPLLLPETDHGDLATLTANPAIALFCGQARTVRHDFALTAANAAAVAAICRRLDGLPLALELAAARVRHAPPAVLLDRLGRGLGELAGGPRDSPDRHRALGDTIAWSHDLLTEPERVVFRRLSVFAGGWTLAAAEAVCAEGLDAAPIADLLASLADQSMVQVEPGASGEPRYTMLETLREFAAEQLERQGETEATAARRDAYFLARAIQAPTRLQGTAAAREWREFVRIEDANLQACLIHLHDRDQTRAMQLLAQVGMVWWSLGLYQHVRYWTTRFATPDGDAPASRDRVRVLTALATTLQFVGETEAGIAYSEQALRFTRALDDPTTLVISLANYAAMLRFGGHHERSIAAAREAVAVARRIDHAELLAYALCYLGATHYAAGENDRAEVAMREAFALRTRHSDQITVTLSRQLLAYLLLERGVRDEADRLLQDGPRTPIHFPGPSDPVTNAQEVEAARAALRRGAYDLAAGHADAALRVADAEDADADRAFALATLARVALARGEVAAARQWAAEAIALARSVAVIAADNAATRVLARCLGQVGDHAAASLQAQYALVHGVYLAHPLPVARSLDAWGRVALNEGQTDRAARKLFAALHLAHAHGEAEDVVSVAAMFALACHRRGHHAEALRLWAAADALAGAADVVLFPADRAERDAATPTSPAGLTAREVEVLRLVAAGLTNAEIADRLSLSVRTVTTHLTHIYTKLDVSTRGAAIRFALDHELR